MTGSLDLSEMETGSASNRRRDFVSESVEHLEKSGTTRKTNVCRIMKMVFSISCLVGLSYQASSFLIYYFSHPTVFNLEIVTPESFIAPAFTICNTNPVLRSSYCYKYPAACVEPPDVESFCGNWSFLCDGNTTDYRYPNPAIHTHWLGIEDIQFLSEHQYQFYSRRLNQEHIDTVFFEDSNGLFRQCFAHNSYLESKNEVLIKEFDLPVAGRYSTLFGDYVLDVDRDQLFLSSDAGVLFSVHSPFEADNPFLKGVLLKLGHAYDIHIRLEEEWLLPFPYQTDCTYYEEQWRMNNKIGPRSQQVCKDNCQKIFVMKCYGCVEKLVVYSSLTNICGFQGSTSKKRSVSDACDSREGEVQKELQQCLKDCKKECVKLKYHFKLEERFVGYKVDKIEKRPSLYSVDGDDTGGYILENNPLDDHILVNIFVDGPEIQVMAHKPKYMPVEIFSYIGGFMGFWLGISNWSFGSIIDTICSCVSASIKASKLIKCLKRKDEKASEH